MPKPKATFAIDNTLTVDQNLEAFLECIKNVDASLAGVISGSLADMSNDIPVDQSQLLDSLYAATEPSPGPTNEAALKDGSVAG